MKKWIKNVTNEVPRPLFIGDYKSRTKSITENISYGKGTILLLIKQNQIGYYKFQ